MLSIRYPIFYSKHPYSKHCLTRPLQQQLPAVFPTEMGMRASPGHALSSAEEPQSLPLAPTLGKVCTLLCQPWPVGDFLTSALQGCAAPSHGAVRAFYRLCSMERCCSAQTGQADTGSQCNAHADRRAQAVLGSSAHILGGNSIIPAPLWCRGRSMPYPAGGTFKSPSTS